MGGKWSYSCCFVGYGFQDLFESGCCIEFLSSFYSKRFKSKWCHHTIVLTELLLVNSPLYFITEITLSYGRLPVRVAYWPLTEPSIRDSWDRIFQLSKGSDYQKIKNAWVQKDHMNDELERSVDVMKLYIHWYPQSDSQSRSVRQSVTECLEGTWPSVSFAGPG